MKKASAENGSGHGRGRYQTDPEKFCKVWEDSESAQEAASRLGLPVAIASARAASYRAAGVYLKKMPRKRTKRALAVESLNQLIDKVRKQQQKKGRKAPPPGPPPPNKIVLPLTSGVSASSVRDAIAGLFPPRE